MTTFYRFDIMKNLRIFQFGIVVLLCGILSLPLSAQTEVMAWSNITGVRVDGELIDFESSLRVGTLKGDMEITGKEKQVRPVFHREGNMQEVTATLRGVKFHQKVTDKGKGLVEISIDALSDTTLNQAAYYCIALSPENYIDAKVRVSGRKLTVTSANRKLEFKFNKSVKATVEKESTGTVVYISLMPILKKAGRTALSMELHASGVIDHSDAEITLDMQNPGSLFAGFGGNFRLQNPAADPKVIDYCLENLRVAYGRVEFPWRLWQPEEESDPIAVAQNGGLNKRVEESLLMAKRLKAMGMPVILSCWFPPAWAIDGGPASYARQGGVIAYRLDNRKKEKIYKSMADYLLYAKRYYGIEFSMFSFNESDLGIDVLHTPQEHADFIKEFGAYLAGLNLPTRMLLGDNSDATTFDFILPALNNPETHKYIGAVSFHSWRGCDDVTLRKWAGAAKEINVLLLVGEGSTDAAAHGYAEIFNESTFALYEINLYTRICAICQPLSILQWQLTSDYSLLWGGGIYGSKGPLRPTQRFWNIKQLASTPADALAIPVSSSKKNVNCAAFGNMVRGEYAVHMVNNGADCEAVISGIPAEVKELKVYVTNTKDCMKETAVKVENGKITDKYSTFVNPQVPIPFEITQLTSIDDSMVMDAPKIDVILPQFLEFVGDASLVAHNAGFDVGFIEQNCKNLNIEQEFVSVDTVALARVLLPTLSKYKLNIVAKALNISLENHHRAVDDAGATAEIFVKFVEMLKEREITTLKGVNAFGATNPDAVKKMPTYHAIILAKNDVGRVNLYRLISLSHLTYYARRPRIPKSEFNRYREGLLIGSACEAGELYQAVLNNKSEETIARLVEFYDYLEIQPLGNNRFMVDSPRYSQIRSDEDLKDINRKIVKLGEEFHKPVVATCDVHFLDAEDEVYRRIIMTGKGFGDADSQPPL